MAFHTLLRRHSVLLCLILLTLIALLLRLIHFSNTTWGYDQARDAFHALDIFGKDPIKLIGPTTDIRGLFHGSLYWYLIAPFYTLSHGDPLLPKLALIILHLFNIPLIYFIGHRLTGKEEAGLLAAFFYAVSFDATQYARWMSNPTLAVMTVAAFFYGFWVVIHKKPVGLGVMFFMWALSIQLQFFLVYLGVFIIIAIWKGRSMNGLMRRENLILYAAGIFLLLPFIVSEIKFGMQGTQSLLGFFIKSGEGGAPLAQKVDFYLNSILKNTYYSVAGMGRDVAKIVLGGLVIYSLYTAWKVKSVRFVKLFLLMWFFSPILIYPIQKNGSYFLNIGNSYPLIILTALSIFEIAGRAGRKYQLPIIVTCAIVIAYFNIQLIDQQNRYGEEIFSVQRAVDLQTEKQIIDWLYKDTGGKEFAINSITNPLFINTTWAYLFEYYAQPRHGRKPFWAGEPIDARHPGWDIPFNPRGFNPGNNLYLIIEPTPGIPEEYIAAYQDFEDTRSVRVKTFKFGTFTVEKRLITKPEGFSRDAVFSFIQ